MTQQLTYRGTIVTTNCWCGIWHGVPQELYDHMLAQHNDGRPQTGIYCPLGHNWTFGGKGAAERERERAERLERQLANRDEDLRSARASVTAMKGQVTKMKKREANGVCPCCNRTFANVARHMTTKHPDYSEAPTQAPQA